MMDHNESIILLHFYLLPCSSKESNLLSVPAVSSNQPERKRCGTIVISVIMKSQLPISGFVGKSLWQNVFCRFTGITCETGFILGALNKHSTDLTKICFT